MTAAETETSRHPAIGEDLHDIVMTTLLRARRAAHAVDELSSSLSMLRRLTDELADRFDGGTDKTTNAFRHELGVDILLKMMWWISDRIEDATNDAAPRESAYSGVDTALYRWAWSEDDPEAPDQYDWFEKADARLDQADNTKRERRDTDETIRRLRHQLDGAESALSMAKTVLNSGLARLGDPEAQEAIARLDQRTDELLDGNDDGDVA